MVAAFCSARSNTTISKAPAGGALLLQHLASGLVAEYLEYGGLMVPFHKVSSRDKA